MKNIKTIPKILIICKKCGFSPTPKKENVWDYYNMKCICGEQLSIQLVKKEVKNYEKKHR